MNIVNLLIFTVVIVLLIFTAIKLNSFNMTPDGCKDIPVSDINSDYMNDVCKVYGYESMVYKNIFKDVTNENYINIFCIKRKDSTIFVTNELSFMEEGPSTKLNFIYETLEAHHLREGKFQRNMINFFYKIDSDFISPPFTLEINERYYGNIKKCFN